MVAQHTRPQAQPTAAVQLARSHAQPTTVVQQARPQPQPAKAVDDASEIWHVQVAAGDVRVVDLDKLDDLFRFEVIDENAFVWQKGMQKWARLGDLLGPPEEEPDEPFHVLFGPGNVRVLTLDELNDFYRYEVIDESTLIWQKGMSEWQTLGRAAGIDEAVLPFHAAASSAAPQHQAVGTGAVTAARANAVDQYGVTVAAAPSAANAVSVPARSVAPMAPSARAGSAASPVMQATLQAPAASPLSHAPGRATLPVQGITRPAPAVQVTPSSPFSTRPVSLSIEPYANAAPPRASRWLVRLAVAAGVILAILRNDVVHAALEKSPLLAQYEQAERSILGGPAFGTTRSVDQLVASCGGHLDSVHLPIAVTQFGDAQKRGTALDAKRTEAEASPQRDASGSADRGARANSNVTTPSINATQPPTATPSTALGSSKAASDMAKALTSTPSKPAAKAPVVSQPSKRRAPSAKAAAKSGVKGGGSYYDPLNGAL